MAGAILGLITGLLIAPKKGEELRNDIADTADKWTDKFNKMVGRTGAQLQDLRDILGREIEGLSDDVRHRIMTILDEVEDMRYNPRVHADSGVL
jgi:gas vesicle protein